MYTNVIKTYWHGEEEKTNVYIIISVIVELF